MSEKKWALREGEPRCKKCNSLLQPVDEPAGFRCTTCRQVYPLTERELVELTYNLSD